MVPYGTRNAYIAAGWTEEVFKGGVVEENPKFIAFADANIKAISVTNWDTDCDSEISYDEAATIYSLENVFSKNTTITSFNELQYYTGLSKIEYGAFEGCTSLTSITIPYSATSIENVAFKDCTDLISIQIPNSVTSIGEGAFEGCTSLKSITIPNSVKNIREWTFYKCYGLTKIAIPNSVTSIECGAFGECTNMKDICVSHEDPNLYGCDSNAFYQVDKSTCVLHVPVGCKEAYATTSPWNEFTNIVEEVLTGIKGVENEVKKADAYYNLQGQRMTEPQRGLNIIRYSNGTSKKVLVK